MSEARDPNQADFDLERVMELFDTALTSRDERVQNALRQLLTIVALTSTQEDGRMAIEQSHGPLRQMQQDINNLSRSLHRLREEVHIMQNKMSTPYNPYPGTPQGPYPGIVPQPGTGTGPWGPNPNAPYTLGGSVGGYGPVWQGTSSGSAPTNLNNSTNTIKITK